MKQLYKNQISSNFDYQLYRDVFVAYKNKFSQIQKKVVFENCNFVGFIYYKNNTKIHKAGDIKQICIHKWRSNLSECLTYLARYGNQNTLEYVKAQLKTCDSSKTYYYLNILEICKKFGFDRLLNLALMKRERILKKYIQKPIVFQSLTFSGRSRKSDLITYNKKFGSKINAFINLSGFNTKSFYIPVKYNKSWHGSLHNYHKTNADYEYTLVFKENTKQIKIYIGISGERYIPQAGSQTIGIDVNCKHNLFSLSNKTTYDYNRHLVNDFCKLSLKIDQLKNNNKNYKIGKRKQKKLNTLKNKMIKSEQCVIANMCKNLQTQGYNHIVMENLNNGFGKCYVKDSDNGDINYNRKIKFLGLSSLKQEVEHIARKYDIAVSTVHASYTSKMCPMCGCIDDENRLNQETFECIECGHKDNADFNAAINIKNRVDVTVLRDKLLKQLDNGAFEPKKLKRERVKEVLLSFQKNLQKYKL